MVDTRNVWLKALLSASLVASLVPAPALAEAADGIEVLDGNQEEVVILDGEGVAVQGEPEQDEAAPLLLAQGDQDTGTLLQAQTDGAVAMELDEAYSVSFEEGGSWIGSFTAPEDGIYCFASSDKEYGDPYGYLYTQEGNEIAHSDDDGGDNNFKITATLAAGEQVTLKATGFSGYASGYTVRVSKRDENDFSLATLSLSKSTFTSAEVVGGLEAYVTVVDAAGKTLEPGSDYDLMYVMYVESYDEYGDWQSDRVETLEPPNKTGDWYVYARAREESAYSGQTNESWLRVVDPHDLGGAELRLSKYNYVSTDMPSSLSSYVTVSDATGNVLVEGRDYELAYYQWEEGYDEGGEHYSRYKEYADPPAVPGRYEVVARACDGSSYTGKSSYWEYEVVDASNIGSEWYDGLFTESTLEYTGEPVTLPEPLIRHRNEDEYIADDSYVCTYLEEGEDFELDHIEDAEGATISGTPTQAGSYQAVYRGKGEYSGTRSIGFEVSDSSQKRGLWNTWASLKESRFVEGAVNLEVRITDSETYDWLEEGTDFELAYYTSEYDEDLGTEVPTEPGEYHAVYRGINKYEGETSCWFSIGSNNDLKYATLTVRNNEVAYTGDEVEPVVVLTDASGNVIPKDQYNLVYYGYDDNWDRVELAGRPVQAGEYSVAARAVEGGDYCGETDSSWFCVTRVEWGSNEDDPGNLLAPESLTLDTPKSVTTGQGQRWRGAFTAPEDAVYRFTSAGGGDARAHLYVDEDCKFEIATYDDGEDGNFSVEQRVAGGQTVFLVVNGYANNALDTTVKVAKASNGDLCAGSIWVHNDAIAANGEPVVLDVTVYDAFGNALTAGADYSLQYSVYEYDSHLDDWTYKPLNEAPSKPGYYYVSAKGEGNYSGSTDYRSFSVVEGKSLNDGRVNVRRYRQAKGAALEAVVYSATDEVLTEGVDYELQFAEIRYGGARLFDAMPTEVGHCYVRAVAKQGGLYTGNTGWSSFEIYDPFDLAEVGSVRLVDSMTTYRDETVPCYLYTSGVFEPEIQVWADVDMEYEREGVSLVEGTDYTVSFKNNDKLSTYGRVAEVTVTGIGKYHGSTTRRFSLVESYNLRDALYEYGADVTFDGATHRSYGGGNLTYLACGTAIQPTVAFASGQGELVPVADTDFTVSYATAEGDAIDAPVEPGSYAVVLTGKGRLAGTATIPFEIVEAKSIEGDVSAVFTHDGLADWTGYKDWTVYGYSGTPKDLDCIKLYDGAKQLVKGVDYEDAKFLVSANEARILFRGVGIYTGSMSCTLRTAPYDIANATVTLGAGTYSGGQAVKPSVVVEVKGSTITNNQYATATKTLTAGIDYDVLYDATKVNAGDAATVIVTGKGGYTGTASATFTIAKAASSISLAAQSKTFNNKAQAYGGKVTKSGSTGAVSYKYYSDSACTKSVAASNVKNVATYYVKATVAADANYNAATSKATTFKITKAASKISIVAQTKTFNNKNQSYSGKVTKSGSNGKVTYAYYSDAKCTKKVTPKAAKTYYVKATVAATANYNAATSAAVKFTIKKAGNPITVKAANKSASFNTLKSKAVTVARPIAISKAQGKLTYAKKGGSGQLSINKTTGKVTVKKGTKRGTYSLKVAITAAGNANYNKATKTIWIKVYVK